MHDGTECSEQSAGVVILLALAFFVGSEVELKLPIQENCYTVQRFEYKGRGEDGRAKWNYPTKEVCSGE